MQSLLENYLPESVLKLIDLSEIEAEKDTMIEEELTDLFSDLIYRVKINNRAAYLYLLFEHKSYPEKKIALQLLKYIRAFWELKAKQESGGKLPLVIPLVFYHGRQQWQIGLSLADLLDEIPVEIKGYIPDFQYIIYDFSAESEEEIKGVTELRIFLHLVKTIFSGLEFSQKLGEIIELFNEISDEGKAQRYFEVVISYVMHAREGIEAEELLQIASEVSAERGEMIMTIAEKLKREGRQEGLEKGIIEGIRKGKHEGIIEGMKEGIIEGKQEGKIEIARKMLKSGMGIEQVIQLTELTEARIRLLQAEIKH